MATIDIKPKGRFATTMKLAVEQAELSLNDLAQKVTAWGVDASYEHMRKLVAGNTLPSDGMLKALAAVLKGNIEEWRTIREADRIYKKYKGGQLPNFLKVSKELEPFAAIVPHLSAKARDTLLSLAENLAKQENVKKK